MDGFAGIEEKLKRTNENILNLQFEIAGFFQKCKYPVFPKLYDKEHAEAVQYHKTLEIPLRFSVLAGEIVHHLRSCLDHVVWELSDDAYRRSPNFRFIEFPILETRPSLEHKFTRYDRKIKGVLDVRARDLIEELQPYQTISPALSPLLIIHNMDIADKHRELAIISTCGLLEGLPSDLAIQVNRRLRGVRKPFTAEERRRLNEYGKLTPQITFWDFSGGVIEPIIPRLAQLMGHTSSVVSRFADLV